MSNKYDATQVRSESTHNTNQKTSAEVNSNHSKNDLNNSSGKQTDHSNHSKNEDHSSSSKKDAHAPAKPSNSHQTSEMIKDKSDKNHADYDKQGKANLEKGQDTYKTGGVSKDHSKETTAKDTHQKMSNDSKAEGGTAHQNKR